MPVVALTVVMGVGVALNAGPAPRIDLPQDVPGQVEELVDATWSSFVDSFPALRDCIGDVAVVLVRDVTGGDASYSASERTIRIEIPTTPERFPESLAHELGHLIEESCSAPEAIGAEFMSAQAIPAGTSWRGGDHWFDTPSEQFAETVVQIVRGERIIHADVINVSDGAVRLVSEWGARS